ncbi:putative C2H2 finger domain protein [Aspergillus fumigatus Af293]|uniref:C2H2 finger domain protein, putative n=2 Tax=Aspergillus fumigatus TaxID=746128 RepID=Q4WA07_ASPFU|nr:C2H2 finger domain protein, putative [Aspergillus fumigatus Af293]EAL84456.1 C2H2 finger domain protein, putative [Aspergillus fumigatus Af293]EDP47403.1 C2H2 finger domain protein, putative [Aspergillus fumigatus A1163]
MSLTILDLQHQQRHQARNLQCYGCHQSFKTFSGMLIHLESGSCPSGTDIDDINRLARQCYQSRKYIDTAGDYICPACDKFCSKLSGLFQHVEDSLGCLYLKEGGQCLAKLEYYISWNVRR